MLSHVFYTMLKELLEKGILYYSHGHLKVQWFPDAYRTSFSFDRRSIIGCVFIGGNLVSWKIKQQAVVTRLSVKSEYRAMVQATCELLWVRNLLEGICFPQSCFLGLKYDDQASMQIAFNLVFHERKQTHRS